MGTTVTVLMVVAVFCAVASVAFHMAYAPKRIHTFTYAPNFDAPFSVNLSTHESVVGSPDFDENFEEETESEIASGYTLRDTIFAEEVAHHDYGAAEPAEAAPDSSRPVPPSQADTLVGIDEQPARPGLLARMKALLAKIAHTFVRRPAKAQAADDVTEIAETPQSNTGDQSEIRSTFSDQPIGISAILGKALDVPLEDAREQDSRQAEHDNLALAQDASLEQQPRIDVQDDDAAAHDEEPPPIERPPAQQPAAEQTQQPVAEAEAEPKDPVIQIADYYKRRRKTHVEPATLPDARHQEHVEHVAERFKEEHHTEQPAYAWVQEALKSNSVGHVDVTTRLRLLRMYGTLHTASAKALLERAIAEDAEVADEARALLESYA